MRREREREGRWRGGQGDSEGKAPVGFKCRTKHGRTHPQIHAEPDRGGAEQGRSGLQAGGGQSRQQPPFGGAVGCAARRFARCGVRVALRAGCYPRSVPHYDSKWTAGDGTVVAGLRWHLCGGGGGGGGDTGGGDGGAERDRMR